MLSEPSGLCPGAGQPWGVSSLPAQPSSGGARPQGTLGPVPPGETPLAGVWGRVGHRDTPGCVGGRHDGQEPRSPGVCRGLEPRGVAPGVGGGRPSTARAGQAYPTAGPGVNTAGRWLRAPGQGVLLLGPVGDPGQRPSENTAAAGIRPPGGWPSGPTWPGRQSSLGPVLAPPPLPAGPGPVGVWVAGAAATCWARRARRAGRAAGVLLRREPQPRAEGQPALHASGPQFPLLHEDNSAEGFLGTEWGHVCRGRSRRCWWGPSLQVWGPHLPGRTCVLHFPVWTLAHKDPGRQVHLQLCPGWVFV